MRPIFYKLIPYVFIQYHMYTGEKKKHLLHALLSHIWTLHFLINLKTSYYDSDLSLQFGGKGREERNTAWTGLTWVHRAETFLDTKGTTCEAHESRSCRAPQKSFTPSSQAALSDYSAPSPTLMLTRHAGQVPAGFPALRHSPNTP